VGHFRRYTKKIRRTEFAIERMFYFNFLGIVGWYINGNLRKNPKINGGALKLFDMTIPFLKYIEKITGRKMGLSIIRYLQKSLAFSVTRLHLGKCNNFAVVSCLH
jgi:hypothetical protein